MRRTKGFLCWMGVLLLSVGCSRSPSPSEPALPSDPASAVVPAGASVAAKPFTFSVSTQTASEGGTAILSLEVTEGSYLVNADMELRYDPDRLHVVRQMDTDTDAFVLARPAQWNGNVYTEEIEPGVIKMMLVSGEDGFAEAGSLCSLAFEVVGERKGATAVTLTVSVCGICLDGTDRDALAEHRVSVVDGGVIVS